MDNREDERRQKQRKQRRRRGNGERKDEMEGSNGSEKEEGPTKQPRKDMHEKMTLAKRQMPNTTAQMDNKNYEKNEPSAPTQK